MVGTAIASKKAKKKLFLPYKISKSMVTMIFENFSFI
jgi:hypothetical protein